MLSSFSSAWVTCYSPEFRSDHFSVSEPLIYAFTRGCRIYVESSSFKRTLCSRSSDLFQNWTLYKIILSRISVVKIRFTFSLIEIFAALRATFDFRKPCIQGGFCSSIEVIFVTIISGRS